VEGRADFVAHVGQEHALGAAGGLSVLPRLGQAARQCLHGRPALAQLLDLVQRQQREGAGERGQEGGEPEALLVLLPHLLLAQLALTRHVLDCPLRHRPHGRLELLELAQPCGHEGGVERQRRRAAQAQTGPAGQAGLGAQGQADRNFLLGERPPLGSLEPLQALLPGDELRLQALLECSRCRGVLACQLLPGGVQLPQAHFGLQHLDHQAVLVVVGQLLQLDRLPREHEQHAEQRDQQAKPDHAQPADAAPARPQAQLQGRGGGC
jgi:hypothetical protein